MKRNLQTISLTVHQTSDLIRYEEFEGRRHLIAPCVAIIEGVLNNFLVPAEAIGKHIHSWAGIPLPLGHPIQDGVALSANSPSIIAASVIGRFWNPQFDGTRLSGELWVDIEKAKRLPDGLDVIRRLEAGESLEISTAFWSDVDPMPGTFKGQSYAGAHHNLVPDHLALLPHDIGACSWETGCGAPRINCTTCQGACGMTHNDTDSLARRFAALVTGLFKAAEAMDEEEGPGASQLETHADDGETKTNQQPRESEPQLVSHQQKGEEPVDKTPVINALIGCAKGTWQEKDRPLLETLEHAVLVRMQEEMEARAEAQTPEPEEDEQEQEETEASAETTAAAVATQAQQPITLEAITQMVTQAVSSAMDARLETFSQQVGERQERQQLTAQLTTHGWTDTELAPMPLTSLRKLAAAIAPANFMGLGLPAFATQAQDDGPSDDPDWK